MIKRFWWSKIIQQLKAISYFRKNNSIIDVFAIKNPLNTQENTSAGVIWNFFRMAIL